MNTGELQWEAFYIELHPHEGPRDALEAGRMRFAFFAGRQAGYGQAFQDAQNARLLAQAELPS